MTKVSRFVLYVLGDLNNRSILFYSILIYSKHGLNRKNTLSKRVFVRGGDPPSSRF